MKLHAHRHLLGKISPRFIIGDVKGKGLDAVGRCAAVLAVFREVAFGEADLADLAASMDARLAREMEIEDFVTVIWPNSRRVRGRGPTPWSRPGTAPGASSIWTIG